MTRQAKYKNTKKAAALKELDRCSLDDKDNNLTERCKFNFSYFDPSQKAGKNFSDLSKEQLESLLESLKEFSRCSLSYWEKQHPRFIIYNEFPQNTEFKHPRHIPHQACWGRFRLGSTFRLVGFVVPSTYDGTMHPDTKKLFDNQTFYVVFIDTDHLFWKTEKK